MQRTFSFVDIAGFTALTEAHGAEVAAGVVARFTSLVQRAIDPRQGRLVDRIGDAAFVVTACPENALSFLQRLSAYAATEPSFPVMRVGLHHGEAIERDGSFYGTSVNIAARVVAYARGSQVLGTRIIAAVAERQGFETQSLGEHALHNVRTPMELFALNLGSPDRLEVIDPVCRMNVHPKNAYDSMHYLGQTYWFCSRHCLRQFAEDPEGFRRP